MTTKEFDPAAVAAELLGCVPDAELWRDGGMTVAEFAAFTKVCRTHVYDLMAHGLPFSQKGRRRVLPKRLAIELLRSGQRDISTAGVKPC